MSDVAGLLEQRAIRPTPNRVLVARCLAAASCPLSIAEIEERIGTVDKSGIFRTLRLFQARELVHTVDDGDGALRYELCHGRDGHCVGDMHAHFKCIGCERIFCLDDQPVPRLRLPDGFRLLGINFVAKGLCADCAAKHP